MTHWAFVSLAYFVAFGATAGLIAWSWLAMRQAEAAADAVKRR